MTFNWLRIVTAGLPAILALFPGLPSVLVPLIIQAISDAEADPKLKGPAKKAYVEDQVATAITTLNATKARAVIDQAKVMPIVSQAVDDGVAIANMLSRR